MLRIPLPNQTRRFQLGCSLAGQSVLLTLKWNPNSATWFLDLRKPNGTAIVLGRQLRPRSLLLPSPLAGFEGNLVVADTDQLGKSLDARAWAQGYQLLYVTLAEVEELALV